MLRVEHTPERRPKRAGGWPAKGVRVWAGGVGAGNSVSRGRRRGAGGGGSTFYRGNKLKPLMQIIE